MTKNPASAEAAPADATIEAFTFGEPEPVMNRRDLIDHIECWDNGRWYETPIPTGALTRAANVSPHHRSAIGFKIKQLVRDFIPHPLLSRQTFEGLALDMEALGNFYLERVDNMLGRPLQLRRSLAKYTRRGLEEGRFFFVPGFRQEHEFKRGAVLQVMKPGLDQEIYGLPDYICALQSAFLNEAATLFRRKYYLNGSHAGFILYLADSGFNEKSVANIKEQLRAGKGAGNFRSMLLHSPNGKKDGVQLLHPGEAAAKDEFLGIKGTTQEDVLAAHRVPPQLLGMVPKSAGGFGDVEKAAQVFHDNETVPEQLRYLAINDWVGQEVVRFRQREARAA